MDKYVDEKDAIISIQELEKLYKDSEKYGIKKKLLAMEYENMISKELTFKPKICRTPKQISSIKFEKFDIRQENFIKNKINNANRLKKKY